MCTVEFQISLCCLQVIVQKLEVFTLPFPQCFWLIWATSWPHCSQCFYCLTVQLGSSRQRGLERAGSGRVLVLESRQLQGRAGVTSLGQGHHPAGVGQGPAQGRQSPGMAGQGHSAGQGRGRHRLWGGWIEGRCSPRASTTCLCSQDPEQSRWEIHSVRQHGATALFWDCIIPIPSLSSSALLQVCYLCSTPFSFFFNHLCENAEGMSIHICS